MSPTSLAKPHETLSKFIVTETYHIVVTGFDKQSGHRE